MNRSRRFLSLLLMTAMGLVGAGSAWSAERFVSPTGNDSTGNGSSANPYRTVKRAISVGQTGDTITILAPVPGTTYNECDVRLRQRMTLRSPAGQRARIHCNPNTSNTVVVQIDPSASGSRISNLEISGGFYYGVMLQTNWYQGGPSSNRGAEDVILEDLLIHGTGRDGIKITPKSNGAIIRGVEIHTTGVRDSGNADGIDNVNGDRMLVEDSYIHNTATTGVYFKGGAQDVIIQRNHIENTGNAGILVGFDTSPEFFDLTVNPQYYESIRGIVRNNVVRNTGYTGIGLYAAKDAIVANNTLVNTAQQAHSALLFGNTLQDYGSHAGRPPSTNPRIVNNLIIAPNNRCIEIRHTSELGGIPALSGSPGTDWNGYPNSCQFRDARPGSGVNGGATLAQWRAARGTDANSKQAAYTVSSTGHLPAGSPAIDAGTTLPQVVDDIDGQTRIAPYDIGADEVVGTGGNCVPPATTTAPITREATPETRTLSCPADQTGAITQQRTRTENGTRTTSWSCPSPTGSPVSSTQDTWLGTYSYGAWTQTSNTCTAPTCTAPPPTSTPITRVVSPQTRTLSCPAGYTGAITQSRTRTENGLRITSWSCPSTTGSPVSSTRNTWLGTYVYGPWTQTGNTCVRRWPIRGRGAAPLIPPNGNAGAIGTPQAAPAPQTSDLNGEAGPSTTGSMQQNHDAGEHGTDHSDMREVSKPRTAVWALGWQALREWWQGQNEQP